jgi:tRNA(Leu) C34 or U34 (ribose-2'-O)-methylase TrmL
LRDAADLAPRLVFAAVAGRVALVVLAAFGAAVAADRATGLSLWSLLAGWSPITDVRAAAAAGARRHPGSAQPRRLPACGRRRRRTCRVAPRDRAVGLNATAIKVASGAADTVPYVTVTNLARSLREMKERDILTIGAASEVTQSMYSLDQSGAVAWVLGAEGEGMRRLTRETADVLAMIPMHGTVESLNVSVASGICLFEARRQRAHRGRHERRIGRAHLPRRANRPVGEASSPRNWPPKPPSGPTPSACGTGTPAVAR